LGKKADKEVRFAGDVIPEIRAGVYAEPPKAGAAYLELKGDGIRKYCIAVSEKTSCKETKKRKEKNQNLIVPAGRKKYRTDTVSIRYYYNDYFRETIQIGLSQIV
jgi:hypothetical protein